MAESFAKIEDDRHREAVVLPGRRDQRKCFRANVDFPAPDGPIKRTRESSGMAREKVAVTIDAEMLGKLTQPAGFTLALRSLR